MNLGVYMYLRRSKLQADAVLSSITGIAMPYLCDLQRLYQNIERKCHDVVHLYR